MTTEAFIFTALIMVAIFGYVIYGSMKTNKAITKMIMKEEKRAARRAQNVLDETDSDFFAPFENDYSRLEKYKEVPHLVDEEFCEIFEEPPHFGKEKWIQEVSYYPLAYSVVVQAHEDLYEPSKSSDSKGIVLVTSLDPDGYYDVEWLRKLAATIQEVRDSEAVPKVAQKLVGYLRDHQSFFCTEVPPELTGGRRAFCWVANVVSEDLPKNKLPAHRILPVFITGDVREDHSLFKLAKAKGYQ